MVSSHLALCLVRDEIGGGNGKVIPLGPPLASSSRPLGIQPMILASEKHLNVPVFDGDLMGRAYPCVSLTLMSAS